MLSLEAIVSVATSFNTGAWDAPYTRCVMLWR